MGKKIKERLQFSALMPMLSTILRIWVQMDLKELDQGRCTGGLAFSTSKRKHLMGSFD